MSIKYTSRYFWPTLTPSPVTTLSHNPGPPHKKYVTHLGPLQIFSTPATKNPDKSPCANSLSVVRGVFVRGFCQRSFPWKFLSGMVLSVPPSVRIHLLQQKVKHHFKYHVSYV